MNESFSDSIMFALLYYVIICYIYFFSRPDLSRGVVALVGAGGSALGPVEMLLDDCGLLLDIVGLGVLDREAEVVKDGEKESDDG